MAKTVLPAMFIQAININAPSKTVCTVSRSSGCILSPACERDRHHGGAGLCERLVSPLHMRTSHSGFDWLLRSIRLVMAVPRALCSSSLFRTLRLPLAVLFCALLAQSSSRKVSTLAISGSQAPAGNGVSSRVSVQKLENGHPRDEELQGGQSHEYQIQLKTGEFLHVDIEEQGISVSARLYDPGGREVQRSTRSDIPYFRREYFGREVLSITPALSGGYKLQVSSPDHEAPAGHYKVEIRAVPKPTPLDLKRLIAEQAFREGMKASTDQSAESSREAIKKFESSMPIWREVGDPYQEATTLQIMGNILFRLGETQKAREYLTEALTFQRSAGDRVGEANSLNSLGHVCSRVGEIRKALGYYSDALVIQRAVGNRSGEAISLRGIARINSYLGDPEKTVDDTRNYYLQALALRATFQNPSHRHDPEVFASKTHPGPLVDLDPGHENRLALGVRTKYQRLTIRQAGRQLRKCTGDVREVSHNDRVCAGRKVCYLLLQPLGLGGRPTLHALTVIPKFDEGLRSTELSQAHGFEGAIGGAREHVADRNP
jgi:tetratricopeptide (TPR) repeat protein